MKKFLTFVFFMAALLISFSTSLAQQNEASNPEKQIIIKGLYIGQDINEARRIADQAFGQDWIVSPVGSTDKITADYRFIGGEERIFGGEGIRAYSFPPVTGKQGFAIQDSKKKTFQGYISTDPSNKVIRISLSGSLIDYIYSAENSGAGDFQDQFRKSFNLPDLYWIPHGWTFTSTKGYTLKIMIDKVLDLKKDGN